MRSVPFVMVVMALGCSGGAGGVPAELLDVEGTAEDAYDKALVGDAATVASDADAIATGWSAYRSRAEADG
ncbi:MAG: hypothetical protein KC621_24425, partial [Myxococcales bacterium]|nr:hypothetical protein [Myxococcales bacterium]